MRRSAETELREATPSLEPLFEITRAVSTAAVSAVPDRVALLARVEASEEARAHDELAKVLEWAVRMPLVLITPDAHRFAQRLLRAGASAVLDLDANEEQMLAAVVCAFRGLRVLPPATSRSTRPDPAGSLAAAPEPLTPRELQILGLLAAGDDNKTIAAGLSISVHTVKFHISSILGKLGVGSRTEAVALALRLGVVLL